MFFVFTAASIPPWDQPTWNWAIEDAVKKMTKRDEARRKSRFVYHLA